MGDLALIFYSLLSTLDNDERSQVEMIFEKYYKLIYETAYKVLNNTEDAEDTVDNVMINVIKNVERFMGVSRNDIEAQLVIYSRNAAINLYNRNKKKANLIDSITFVDEDDNLAEIDIPDDCATLDDIVISKEAAKIIAKHIEKLPPKFKDIIELVYGMGYTNVEAARVLGVSPNAAGLRLFRAKKTLCEMAGDELYELVK